MTYFDFFLVIYDRNSAFLITILVGAKHRISLGPSKGLTREGVQPEPPFYTQTFFTAPPSCPGGALDAAMPPSFLLIFPSLLPY